MGEITYTKNGVLVGLIIWWLLFVALTVNAVTWLHASAIIGFPFLLFVPGGLLLSLFYSHDLEWWGRVSLAIGLSVLLTMFVGLAGNTVLPFVGVEHPLDTVPVVWEVSFAFLALLLVWWVRTPPFRARLPRYLMVHSKRDLVYLAIAGCLVLLSVLGAIRLNNGTHATLTLIMLSCMGLFAFVLARARGRLSENVVPFALSLMALALLLMTSLRGAGTTGHDLQREYFVFELAKQVGYWSITSYQDAYNACLSITILPTMYANMLHLSDPYVYKVLFQIIFATTAGVVYLIARRSVDRRLAFIAAFFFIAFPTFFQDMPFLVRQEVAFLFFGLMLFTLFHPSLTTHLRRTLFVWFGVGVVLSHYSTTYSALFMLGSGIVALPVFLAMFRRGADTLFKNSAIDTRYRGGNSRNLTITMLLILVAASMLWTSFITGTGGHLAAVVQESFLALRDGATEHGRSFDVLRLFSFAQQKAPHTLEEYVTHEIASLRASDPGKYYDVSTYASYEYVVLEPERVPVGRGAHLLEQAGIPSVRIVSLVGQVLAKLLEAALILGFVYVLRYRRVIRHVDSEFYILAGGALLFVACTAVVPILSVEYGLFRALVQSMFLLSPFMAVGTALFAAACVIACEGLARVVRKGYESTRTRVRTYDLATVFVVLFFFYSTAALPQVFGGNLPPLHLATTGSDYDQYVVEPVERAAIDWLEGVRRTREMETGDPVMVMQADRFVFNKMKSVIKEGISDDVYPGAIMKDSYVLLGPGTVSGGRAAALYEGKVILYTYPLAFLEENKNRVYDNGSARVYR